MKMPYDLSESFAVDTATAIFKKLETFLKTFEALENNRIFYTYVEKSNSNATPIESTYSFYDKYLRCSGEIVITHSEAYKKLTAIGIQQTEVTKSLEYLSQKINNVIKFIASQKVKLLAIKKMNKRKLFRALVNLIFKNLDDAHLNFELFQLKNNSIQFKENLLHSKWKKTIKTSSSF